MRKSHFMMITVLLLSLATSVFADDAAPSMTAAAPAGVVNINTADLAQLSNLPRVGAKAAQRIIDYRKEHGPFQKTSDLMQVKGFGEKRFEALSRYVTVSGNTTLASKIKAPRKPRASRKQPATTAS
jgi:competence ComEA-like helix-hairpin-helix protein